MAEVDPIAVLAAERAKKAPTPVSSSETPPKRRGRPPGRPSKAPLQKRLQEAFGAIGLVISMRNPYDGRAILEGAERLSTALDHLARENSSVRRTLEMVLAGGVYGEVLFAVAAIALPIAANHGMLPEQAWQPMSVLFSLPTNERRDRDPEQPATGNGNPTAPLE